MLIDATLHMAIKSFRRYVHDISECMHKALRVLQAVGTPEEDVNYAYNHVNPMQKKSNYKTRTDSSRLSNTPEAFFLQESA